MKRSIVVSCLVLFLVMVASGCSTPGAAADPESITLEQVVVQGCDLRSVAPQGWDRLVADEFYRGEWPADLGGLHYWCYPGRTAEWTIATTVPPALGLEELPASYDTIESGIWTWRLYTVEAELPEVGSLVVDFAIGETEWGTHVIGLTSSPADRESLRAEVFVPAVEAAELVVYQERDRMTRAELTGDEFQGRSPVNNVYFAPMGDAAPAMHTLEGVLTLDGFNMTDALPSSAGVPAGWSRFPGFSVAFFAHGDYLVPAERGILSATSGQSAWDIILSPGRVWSEPGDEGMSRAAFPFALVSEESSEVHNGIATFLYDDTGTSACAVQIVQETSPWNRFDYWGLAPIEYTPSVVEDGEDLAAQFAQELEGQLPIRPWSELAEMYGAEALEGFDLDQEPSFISATGIAVDGTIYLQPCQTRYGEFPYCRYMRHGSFSVSKSMGAAVAMLRLAQVYGPEVFDLRIADYVSVTAEHDGWDRVTFGDALNMATGVGNSQDMEDFIADDSGPRFNEFAAAGSTRAKLSVCFEFGDLPWGPGEIARYNSATTFVLSVAMDNYLKSVAGPDAGIWDMVVEEVYNPIGIAYAPIMRTRELDGSQGVPIFGYGLYPTVEDAVRVALLLQNEGRYDGQQLLHPGMARRALYRTEVAGFPTAEYNENGEGRYNMSFWSMPYRTEDGRVMQIPYMSGFGGNRVILAPNGVVAFRFADGQTYSFESMVRVAENISSFPAPE